MSNHYFYFIQVGKLFLQVIGESLRCQAHRVNIHAVAAGTHDTPQAAGSEFEIFVKCIDQLRFIFTVEQPLHFIFCLGIVISF